MDALCKTVQQQATVQGVVSCWHDSEILLPALCWLVPEFGLLPQVLAS